VDYFGFELQRETEPVREFPPELAAQARHLLAEAVARGDARQLSVKRNRAAIEEVREAYRRSGGATPRLGLAELTALYEAQLADVSSMEEFRNARLVIDPDDFVSPEERERLARLPDMVLVRDREAWIDYDVETRPDGTTYGVARLRLPEKIARTLTDAEVPELDRPVRFTVLRGQRGAVRADTLDELQELLERPWSPDEIVEGDAERDESYEPRSHRRPRHERTHGRHSRPDRRPSHGKRPHGRGERNRPGRGRRPRG
jgi:hypothetical protein